MVLTVIGLVVVLSFWMFIYQRKGSIFVAVNYLLISNLLDLVIIGLMEIVTQDLELVVHVEYVTDSTRICAMCLSKTILFLGCWIIQKKRQKIVFGRLNEGKISFIFVILCAIEYVGIHISTKVLTIDRHISDIHLTRLIFSLIVIFLMLIIIGLLILYYDKKSRLQQKNLYLESLDYENKKMIRLYREREVMYHDFKNHLLVLDGYAQCGNLEQYQLYMEQVKKPFLQKVAERRIGHDIMDLILNYKIGEAERKQIEVKCKIFGYVDFKLDITNEEICSLMGNLWDNAIEACERLQHEKVWIDFRMNIRPGKFLIEILNPCQKIQRDEQGKMCTLKTDTGIHGVGMRTIREIAERYHGYLNCVLYDHEHVFKVELMICNQ